MSRFSLFPIREYIFDRELRIPIEDLFHRVTALRRCFFILLQVDDTVDVSIFVGNSRVQEFVERARNIEKYVKRRRVALIVTILDGRSRSVRSLQTRGD